MTIKKRSSDGAKTSGKAPAKPKAKRTASAAKPEPAKRVVRRPVAKAPAKPRIRASYAVAGDPPGSTDRVVPPLKVSFRDDRGPSPRARPKAMIPTARKPLAAPKRVAKRPAPAPEAVEGASTAARELALALAAAGLDKKAAGIEILDVTGKIDYADFLVVMTGRSDRHVHAIATGIEDSMRRRKSAPQSVEGLASAVWVLLDFGDVVVHVFQEEARALYDIEGMWMDAGRVPVPEEVEGQDAHKPPTFD